MPANPEGPYMIKQIANSQSQLQQNQEATCGVNMPKVLK